MRKMQMSWKKHKEEDKIAVEVKNIIEYYNWGCEKAEIYTVRISGAIFTRRLSVTAYGCYLVSLSVKVFLLLNVIYLFEK